MERLLATSKEQIRLLETPARGSPVAGDAHHEGNSMITFSAPVSAARPKVSYAASTWSKPKRWVTRRAGSIFFAPTVFSSIGVE